MLNHSKTAASASTLNAPGAARFSQPAAERGEAAGQHFHVGVGSPAPTGEPSNLTAAAGTPNRCNLSNLWQVYRYAGYFQREVLAVFFSAADAETFALANMTTYPNGCYVGTYRPRAAHA